MAVSAAFGNNVDHGMIVKALSNPATFNLRWCSPARRVSAKFIQNCGTLAARLVCSSHVDRSNLTIRMQNRGFSWLANVTRRRWENYTAMFAARSNNCRCHRAVSTAPEVAADIASELWTWEWLLSESAKPVDA